MTRWLTLTLTVLVPLTAAAQAPNGPPPPIPVQRPIGLPEAIRLSLEHNLDLAVARAEPAIAREQVDQARGVFDPLLFASSSFDHGETPFASPLQTAFRTTGSVIEEDQWNYQGGFTGLIPFGLSYSSVYDMRRLQSSSGVNALEREFRPIWTSELTLPLLRDLIHNEENVRVKRSLLAQEISNEDFRRTLTDLVLAVETAYWELAGARAEYAVTRKSLGTAENLLAQTRVRYEVGTVSKVLVTQAEAGVAERKVDVIVAANRAANAQDALLDRILAPDLAAFASMELVPQDPSFVEYEVELDAVLERALNARPELEAARRTVGDAELQLEFADNQRLPRLDLTASVGFQGLSGDQRRDPGSLNPGSVLPDGTPIAGTPVVDDGIDSGASNAHGRSSRSWSVGGTVDIPLGNTSARALVSQRRIELRRARTILRREEQRIVLEVREAVRSLRSTAEAVEATQARVTAQAEVLGAEQEKLRLGDSTPHDVLEFEEDLAEAERQQITALQAYRNAIARVERSEATLLARRGVRIEEERSR